MISLMSKALQWISQRSPRDLSDSKQSNGLPLAGVGRGAQGLTGFGSWGTGRQAKGSGTYGL
ncbi:hypothetical protein ANABIO32_41510 [Rossellomorea marisflavi]|nr:hypothetical protein ANABIO32_41510 [Rossellomorea marisflavi]